VVNPVCFEVQDMGWSEEEVQFLKKNYKKMTYYKIAKVLGKSYSSVYMKAYRLQLKKITGVWKRIDSLLKTIRG